MSLWRYLTNNPGPLERAAKRMEQARTHALMERLRLESEARQADYERRKKAYIDTRRSRCGYEATDEDFERWGQEFDFDERMREAEEHIRRNRDALQQFGRK